MMDDMQARRMAATRDRWAGQRADGWSSLAQSAASAAALGVLIWVLLPGGFWPSWPLVTSAVLLGGGLLADLLTRRSGGRPVPVITAPATAFAALLLLGFGVADPHRPASHLRVVALLLVLGLVTGPVARRLLTVRPARDFALPAAALTAMLVFIWPLSIDGYGYFTQTPTTRFINDDIHAGTVRLVLALLAVVLVATALTGPRMTRRVLVCVAAVVALTALLVTLAASPPGHLHPEYPYYWTAAILSLGLAVTLLEPFLDLQLLGRRVEELSRTRSGALDVQAAELRRIERDLHDGAQVRLVALSMKLGRAEDLYRDDPKTVALLREAREDATAAIRELRELARGIAPPVLARRGLDAAVRSLAQRSGIEVTVDGTLTRRLLPAVETAAYFIVAESLANAAKHAMGARVEITLHERGRDLFVEITDFGPGGADPAGGGLTGLRQRVEALDGVLRVTSPPGVGTQVEAVMPCGL